MSHNRAKLVSIFIHLTIYAIVSLGYTFLFPDRLENVPFEALLFGFIGVDRIAKGIAEAVTGVQH